MSGRGVGTSALRAACRAMGGDALLHTEQGRFTEVRCLLPGRVLGPEVIKSSLDAA